MERIEITRPGTLESLDELVGFVVSACVRAGATDAVPDLRLATEEIVTNIVEHGYAERTPGPISLAVTFEPRTVVVTIADHGIPFGPDDSPAPDFVSPIQERRVGGLGWHLIKQVIDEIQYESNPVEGNRLTLVKRTTG